MQGQEAAEFYYLGLNPSKPPFDKVEVRQAIAYAMDRATMVKSVLYGLSPALYTPFPTFSPAYFPEYNGRFAYNLNKAKQLITQAGYPNGIAFTVPTPNNFPEMALFAQILQADLAKIGSKLTIQPMDPASWYPVLLKGTYSATFSFAGGPQIYPTRITLSNNFATSANPVWPGGTPPKAYVQAVQKADTTLIPAQQKAAFKAMVDSFVTEAWNIPIGYRVTLFALKPNVKGFGYDVYSQPRFANVSLA
jgi:peptide/nickel transport system substrate-binding protein